MGKKSICTPQTIKTTLNSVSTITFYRLVVELPNLINLHSYKISNSKKRTKCDILLTIKFYLKARTD